MTENILILEGDHVSIKKNIYFYKRDVKKGLCPKLLQLQWKNLQGCMIYFFLLFLWNK